ncbi:MULTISPECIES: N-formylmaleamate deformylase [Novosphingobium]|jgi:N-formylmaleamate deformylase|uniref:Alpha/beta hydrolase n=1 Tax=Novosphingobium guangzhouense TaxID=1850347 RepID=A0A2K2FUA6_9SPHN|nr:N-formylmaleamate deformylase [Novosphingobium guangzhouense]PNU02375.1 alpha/beta hydrolase [Novosphingobium guangzhouense]
MNGIPLGYNVHANGIRHHLVRHGAVGKRQMLLVPGITSPAVTWDFVAERLANTYEVHVLDVRGRGLSQAGDLDYSLNAMADDVIALTAAIGLEHPVVLGHSMGARTAIRAARKAPGLFGGLILADPPVSGPGRRPYPSAWPWYEDSILLAQRGCSAEEMKEFCPTWTEGQRALRAEWLHTCELRAIEEAYKGFHCDDIHADLPLLDLPMRLVVAGGSPVIQDSDVQEIQTLAKGIEVVTVAGAGHMIPWDDLEGFLQAVAGFQPYAQGGVPDGSR